MVLSPHRLLISSEEKLVNTRWRNGTPWPSDQTSHHTRRTEGHLVPLDVTHWKRHNITPVYASQECVTWSLNITQQQTNPKGRAFLFSFFFFFKVKRRLSSLHMSVSWKTKKNWGTVLDEKRLKRHNKCHVGSSLEKNAVKHVIKLIHKFAIKSAD